MDRRTFFSKSAGWSAGVALLACPGMVSQILAQTGEKGKKGLAKELDDKVNKYLPMYRSCALTSFAALNDHFKLGADVKTIRALMPFTGGIARKGETCGAVSGSLLALGLYFESVGVKAKPGSSLQPAADFFEKFAKAFTSTRCREVVKHQFGRYYDFEKPEDIKLFMVAGKSGQCTEVMKKAVQIAGEIIAAKS